MHENVRIIGVLISIHTIYDGLDIYVQSSSLYIYITSRLLFHLPSDKV